MPLFACLEGALHLETAAVESQALCARAGGHISSVSRGSCVSGMVGLHLFRSEPYFLASLPQESIRDRCQGHGAVRTIIYPYAVPAVLSVCQNQRTPKVMHKSWSLTRHINDVFQLCTDLTDSYSHAFAPEKLSCISLSIVHRHPHMPESPNLHRNPASWGFPMIARQRGCH